MIDEMINTVRAALAPDADAATKQRAAQILRGVLGMLESGSGGAAVSGAVSTEAVAAPPSAPTTPDLLTAIVEHLRPHLPEGELSRMPRFQVPLIKFGR